MWENLFKHIDIHPVNVHILDGNAADLQAECEAYEKKIAEAGGVELFIGGKVILAKKIWTSIVFSLPPRKKSGPLPRFVVCLIDS
jgi:hypothetical protein